MLSKDDETGKFLNNNCAKTATKWTKYCHNDNDNGKIRNRYFDYTPEEGVCESYFLAEQRKICNIANCAYDFCISERDRYVHLCDSNTNR